MKHIVSNLIDLKMRQVHSLESGDWDEVHKVEQLFKKLLIAFQLNETSFSIDTFEHLQELMRLNEVVTQQALLQRDTLFQQLIEIKKGKLAAKAYLDGI